jgi:hypothetical protein
MRRLDLDESRFTGLCKRPPTECGEGAHDIGPQAKSSRRLMPAPR